MQASRQRRILKGSAGTVASEQKSSPQAWAVKMTSVEMCWILLMLESNGMRQDGMAIVKSI
jgi:hypothetical protein